MKKVFIIFNLVLITISITACGEKNYTVSDLKDDSKLRNEILSKCSNGEKISPKNCENARKAKQQIIAEKLLN